MKFTIGKLGVELLFSWNPSPDTPPLSIPPKPNINPPVTLPPAVKPDVVVKNIRDVVYTITSAFEGGPIGKINYGNLSGNFDGQGYSIGFLQWCVGQGSDVKLFTRVESKYPGVLKSCLGANLYVEFIQHLHKPLAERLRWAQKAVNTSADKVEENWKFAFKTLCATKEFQECQNFYAEDVFQRAVAMCKEYGLRTNRALMLVFDICTQNGSIKSATKATILAAKEAKEKVLGRVLKEKEYLELIAIKRAEASNPRWVADVKSRKLCIVYGSGVVHGDKYDLNKMGLDDGPIVL
jgi:hypothetical protein